MLSFNDQYNIMGGIYFTFNNKKQNKRSLSVSHSQKKRDNMKNIFNYSKYEDWTKENFIVACLYINFIKKPSSFISSFEELNELDKKVAYSFKNEIIHYRKFFREDLEKIKIEEGGLSFEYIRNAYRKNEIKWYTFYFYLLASNQDISKLEKSRIDAFLYRRITKMLLYITFSQKSIIEMRELIKDVIEI